jgi:hypothetical protein
MIQEHPDVDEISSIQHPGCSTLVRKDEKILPTIGRRGGQRGKIVDRENKVPITWQ